MSTKREMFPRITDLRKVHVRKVIESRGSSGKVHQKTRPDA